MSSNERKSQLKPTLTQPQGATNESVSQLTSCLPNLYWDSNQVLYLEGRPRRFPVGVEVPDGLVVRRRRTNDGMIG